MQRWERGELISNLVNLTGRCDRDIRERMIPHLSRCDVQCGGRAADGLGLGAGSQTADAAGAR
jgi:catalase